MIRFGVIGAGNIAHTFSQAMKATPHQLFAVASRGLNKAQDFMNTYGYQKAYGSYEALLRDPDVDCVYIATPHGLHYEHMMLALDYNKPILCEKSFTLNAKQAENVLYQAQEKKLFVMEAIWTRMLPTIQELKKELDGGIIGDLVSLEASFGFDLRNNGKDRMVELDLGAGALLDIGVYPIHFAHLIFGNPKRFETEVQMDPRGFDLSESFTFFYDHQKAVLKSSMASTLDQVAKIYGTKGYAEVPYFWSTQKAMFYDLSHTLIKTIEHPHLVNGFEYEINEAASCIENGQIESKHIPHMLTIEIMKEMDALRNAWGMKLPKE